LQFSGIWACTTSDGLENAGGTVPFARVHCFVEKAFVCKLESIDVGLRREALFGPGNIQGSDGQLVLVFRRNRRLPKD
jgi:hypothetical protein